ncbi:hypothetical protein GQ53DRAFT_845110 [Thozetella sp. PMI_491]|nr:hypothetical protein GQ53DRAFT_845110 [Thozetella sp. PMI_491]
MAPQSGPKTQYQHFVPQFLLRNFSHPYVDPDSATLPRGKKARRRNGELVPGDAVVSSAALSEDPIALTETPVRRILGQMDMYNDTGHPQAPNHIEKMFGDIESRVSTIFRKITKAFAAKDVGLWLTRAERNDVRKFLFLLKYRGWGFYKRFNHNAPEEYNSDDRDLFLDYMAQRGFTRPIDVWFDNLKAIMELKMDVEGEWMSKIRKRIYFQDAEWFVKHTQFFYMAVCTPEEPSHEFIITDGCYNVFEGRSTFAKDLKTGEIDPTEWINFHEFTPISPKLMIVLRSCGSATMFWHDLEQSKRMWTLRVKIDSWSQGVDEYIRRRNRNLVTAAYLRCPPFRFWLYMKLLKFIVTKDPSALLRIGSRESKALEYGFNDVEDAEDIIATARIINYDADINQLIYATVTNEIEMRKHPGLKLWQRLSPTWLDLPRFLLMHKFVFQIPGSICGCGIPEIELYAQIEEQKLQSKVSIDIQGFDTSPFSEDQVIEIVTRIKVREIFVEILKERMKLEHLQKLKKVFFELTYPTPPTI